MVRHKLDSVNEFARQGYLLLITCNRCHRSITRHPTPMMLELHRLGCGYLIDPLERRLRCKVCRSRGATITPTYPDA